MNWVGKIRGKMAYSHRALGDIYACFQYISTGGKIFPSADTTCMMITCSASTELLLPDFFITALDLTLVWILVDTPLSSILNTFSVD